MYTKTISDSTEVIDVDSVDIFLNSIKYLLPSNYERYDSLVDVKSLELDQQDNTTQEISLLIKVSNNYKLVFGNKSIQYSKGLDKLATVCYDTRNLQQAIQYQEESMKILTNNYPEKTQEIILSQISYLVIKSLLNFKKEDRERLNYITTHLEEIADSVALSECMYNIANTYINIGEYGKSIKYYEKCLAIDSIPSKSTIDVLGDLCQLAFAYIETNNYIKAKEICEQGISICSENRKLTRIYFTKFKSHLALCYYREGKITNAISIEKDILPLVEKEYGRESYDYAISIGNLGSYYREIKDFVRCLKYSHESLKILKKCNGCDNLDYAWNLANVACSYARMNEYNKAIEYYSQVKLILKRIGLTTHPRYIESLNGLAYCFFKLNQLEDLEKTWDERINIPSLDIFQGLLCLSEKERSYYWDNFTKAYNHWSIYYSMSLPTTHMCQLAYTSTLFSKSVILNSEIVKRTLLSNSKDIMKEKMSTDLLGIYKYDSIQSHLNATDIAVEFVNVRLSEDSIAYFALTLNHQSAPKLYFLCYDKDIKRALKSDSKYVLLYNLIWKPVEKELQGKENIYFSPTGSLYTINIEIIPQIHNGNDKNYYRLTSTRNIIQPQKKYVGNNVTLYAGLNYQASNSKPILESQLDSNIPDPFYHSLDSVLERGSIVYLPATLVEGNDISKIFERSKWNVNYLQDINGTEESFKLISGKNNRYIHVATHGFYFEDNKKNNIITRGLNTFDDGELSNFKEDKALERSGLLFSGCIPFLDRQQYDRTVDDGILFSKEIVDLDLSGVDLISLSACDTGLGDISSEGVFGLQRAFKEAGVNSILMSLWKVDDNATRLLLTRFYHNLITLKMSKVKALKEAQDYVRNYEVDVEDGNVKTKEKIYNDPKYWASFILLDALN